MISLLPANIVSPVVVVDSREQQALRFERLPSIVAGLQSGDYSARGIEHLLAIERKSCADVVASVTTERERFERELHRPRGFDFKRILCCCTRQDIENHNYRSQAAPRAILASLAAFEVRYNTPIIFAGNPATAALLVEEWIFFYAREVVKRAETLTKAAGLAPAVASSVAPSICPASCVEGGM